MLRIVALYILLLSVLGGGTVCCLAVCKSDVSMKGDGEQTETAISRVVKTSDLWQGGKRFVCALEQSVVLSECSKERERERVRLRSCKS